MQGKALPGFRDFYPDELALRNHIFATWRSVSARYGFEEYDGPPLEPLELYTQKSGDEIVIWELWENGQYVELSALGVLFILALFVLVTAAQWLGGKFGVRE